MMPGATHRVIEVQKSKRFAAPVHPARQPRPVAGICREQNWPGRCRPGQLRKRTVNETLAQKSEGVFSPPFTVLSPR
jgi:hypothetical protein